MFLSVRRTVCDWRKGYIFTIILTGGRRKGRPDWFIVQIMIKIQHVCYRASRSLRHFFYRTSCTPCIVPEYYVNVHVTVRSSLSHYCFLFLLFPLNPWSKLSCHMPYAIFSVYSIQFFYHRHLWIKFFEKLFSYEYASY